MVIEIGDNGLRSRYEWTTIDVPSNDPIEAAYQAIRKQYTFLTDDNHTWAAEDCGPPPDNERPHLKRLRELTQSSRYSIAIYRSGAVGKYDISYWFHVAYRVPGQPEA